MRKVKVQICQRCKKVFAVKETIGGPGLGMPSFDELGSTICPYCGGKVVWQEEGKREDDPLGCIPIILLILLGCFSIGRIIICCL